MARTQGLRVNLFQKSHRPISRFPVRLLCVIAALALAFGSSLLFNWASSSGAAGGASALKKFRRQQARPVETVRGRGQHKHAPVGDPARPG